MFLRHFASIGRHDRKRIPQLAPSPHLAHSLKDREAKIEGICRPTETSQTFKQSGRLPSRTAKKVYARLPAGVDPASQPAVDAGLHKYRQLESLRAASEYEKQVERMSDAGRSPAPMVTSLDAGEIVFAD